MMFPKQSRDGLAKLDAKLWRLFSKFIRARDCPDGWGKCITCGRVKPVGEMDSGHFIGRRHKATKFDERNVHAQCRACNRFNSGEAFAFSKAIDAKYGAGTADMLHNLSKMRGCKLDRMWYEEMIRKYGGK